MGDIDDAPKRLPRASQAEPSVLFERSALPPLSPEERVSLQRVSSEELGQHRRVATVTSPWFERLRFHLSCLLRGLA
ncbi:hypothetical protein NDU88_002977 [Pleurodeles waltl]|uniref:Uncharacterized protein n=1 Tax=Pleurodeles waltl TaxID=8319 RepID=A0AAV7UCS1_PLEWA|nr:hypothetical protein NDU88_002977 [Pleurodeles waltl]